MPYFTKKPAAIEAHQWDGTAEGATPIIDWVLAGGGTTRYDENAPRLHSMACRCDGRGIVPGDRSAVPCPETEPTGGGTPKLSVDTLEGTMTASPGDWIIRGVKGEFYPCKPDIFTTTYDPAIDPPPAPEPRAEVDPWGALAELVAAILNESDAPPEDAIARWRQALADAEAALAAHDEGQNS
jgi:hypothetical protein